jgi:hypothetical protein
MHVGFFQQKKIITMLLKSTSCQYELDLHASYPFDTRKRTQICEWGLQRHLNHK